MALTDINVANAKPGERLIKMYDGEGLLLLIKPTGAKPWRLKYRFHGQEKALALGKHPRSG